MWPLFDAVVFAAGYVASIYSWPIKLWVNGVQAEIAASRGEARRPLTMWCKIKSFCLHSLSVAWGYALAFVSVCMRASMSLPKMRWAIRT